MRRYPPPRYTKPTVDGTGASFVLMLIAVCCPPLGLLAYLVYGLFEDFFNSLRR